MIFSTSEVVETKKILTRTFRLHGVDNTSFFIAADFDETNWKESLLKLYQICQDIELPAVIERSRSGNGGHLWLFFEGKLVQYIGRIQRSGKPPVIYDYRDYKIDYFEKMFKQRNRYYNKQRK